MKETGYKVVWPRGKRVIEKGNLAKRLGTLEGKTIGFMWDGIFLGDKVYPVIEEELVKRYPRSKFVNYEVFGITHARGDEAKVIAAFPDKLKRYKCDAVISGIGC